MTEDDQRQITTEVLQEHKEAQTRLGCLRSKARRMARSFSEIADALVGRPQSGGVKRDHRGGVKRDRLAAASLSP